MDRSLRLGKERASAKREYLDDLAEGMPRVGAATAIRFGSSSRRSWRGRSPPTLIWIAMATHEHPGLGWSPWNYLASPGPIARYERGLGLDA